MVSPKPQDRTPMSGTSNQARPSNSTKSQPVRGRWPYLPPRLTTAGALVFLAFCLILYARPYIDRRSRDNRIYIPSSAQFVLAETYVGNDFFGKFNWETLNDPTHGRVNYVDMQTAQHRNLSYTTGSSFVMKADNTNFVLPNQRGRDSVRIISKASYADSLVVIDVEHMPTGCGTWPAFWSLSAAGPWPRGGEIDIIEGVHKDNQNLASLHTLPGCTMPSERFESGTPTSPNCDASVNYNQGCGVSFNKPNSFGAPFNAAGGGWFAMRRTAQAGIQIWFWSRNDPSVPLEIKLSPGASLIETTALWGFPEASFPTDSCNYPAHFDAHKLVFDLTFCGDWAGATWGVAGCGSGTCNNFVDSNPSAFNEAYWEVNSLYVYTPL